MAASLPRSPDTQAASPTQGESRQSGFLVYQFHSFYAEVLRMAKVVEQRGERGLDGEAVEAGWSDSLTAIRTDSVAGSPAPGASPPATPTAGADGIPPALAAHLAANSAGGGPQSNTQTGSDPANPTPAPGTDAPALDNWPSQVDLMVHRLAQLLDLGYDHAARLGGAYGATLYTDAKYAMAALADEVFLHQAHWGGAEAWGEDLLEARMFGTSLAGERLFHKIDAVLKEASPINIELAAVYLLVLTLGFRGRYRGRDDSPLDSYRQRLRSFIGTRLPAVQADQPIFASAYHSTLDEGREQLLPAIGRWVWLAVFALLAYLAVSHSIWLWLTDPVKTIIRGG
jgi:type VI secretion system protein ImpK